MQVQAVNITEIKGVETTEDGERALVRFTSGENEAILAFPFEQLIPLMQAASTGFTKCQKAQDADPNAKHVLPCEILTAAPSPDFQHMIFSFRLDGGMEMSYSVPREHAARLREFVSVFLQEPGKIPLVKAP